MSRRDEYQRNASVCQRMAHDSTNEDDKRQWLRLERAWIDLLRTSERAWVETLEAEHAALGVAAKAAQG